MTKEERTKLLKQAIDTYGRQAQVDMMLEEMSELTKALLKERRVPPLPVSGLEHAILSIREEMADVQIVLDQMKQIYGDTSAIEEEKLQRLKGRLGRSWQDSPLRKWLDENAPALMMQPGKTYLFKFDSEEQAVAFMETVRKWAKHTGGGGARE